MTTTPFVTRVINAVRRIPPGRVATYGDVAAMAGRARAWRAVGNIMAQADTSDAPCHRVVAAGGRLGGFGGRPDLKRALLRAEGVIAVGDRVRQFARIRWHGARRTAERRESAQ